MKGEKIKVAVAMSGGVDSSVAAALLVKKGYSVEGIYMRLSGSSQLADNNEKHARAVAKKIGIKFKVLDFRKEFEKKVINYFLKELKAGRTPNPCVVCNQQIKFGLLFDKALNPLVSERADFMATGHYANKSKIKMEQVRHKKQQKSKIIYKFWIAKDKTKDQSYFLYNLTQEKLTKILFPLGDYKKSEVYKMAEKWELPYKKGESVDICFVGAQGYRRFLQKHLGIKKGKIIDVNGKTLGEHQGLWFYTIGQRADIGGSGPFYVVKLDKKNNAVIVSNNFRDSLLVKKNLIVENVNWTNGKAPGLLMQCNARIRYGHAAVKCSVKRFQKKYLVEFKNPQRAITPGQSAVFYKRNEILGGGVIEN